MRRRIAPQGNGNKTKGWILSNAIIKATAATAAAATLLGVGVTPAFAKCPTIGRVTREARRVPQVTCTAR